MKQPINRKLAVVVVGTIGVLVLIAVALMFAHSNPEAKRAALVRAQEQQALASLPHGTQSGAETLITQHAGTIGDTQSLYDAQIVPPTSAQSGPAKASTAGVPPVDQTTLAQLEAAYTASGHKPSLSSGGGDSDNGKTGIADLNSFGSKAGSPATGTNGVFQDYPKAKAGVPNAAQAAGLQPDDASDTAKKTYAAAEPLQAPATRILTTGTLIRAVLTDAIDTHSPGTALATVSQNVYDSLDSSTLLIPAGSRLVGTYQTTVQPGLPRIPVTFTTLYLPDGRMVSLDKTQSVDYAGATGVPGKYHSNILRALGPSLVVALIGTAIDRESNKNNNQSGFGMQAPSVTEQMAPQVNSAVMQRYQGAQPYFIVKAGTPFKIVLGQNIVIPVTAGTSHPAVTGHPQVAPEMAPPGAGVWQASGSGDNQ